ncbi:hypothetical protein [Vibrio owensii]|uniref:hypothetical protein n=1 Tax=Vibrio harveyi group TaxID=717610 RepID=UPI003CC536F3
MKNHEIELLKSAIRKHPEIAKEMAISGQSLTAYRFTCNRDMATTANHLSKHLEVSIPHASNLLKKLEQKGYLSFILTKQSSGGYEKEYSPIKN